jgi:glycosyltransferase involved in cell wall biosynthesis
VNPHFITQFFHAERRRDVSATRQAPPGLSIVVANWNHEFVLPRAVRSAMLSMSAMVDTGINSEVLVIDDASRDGSVTLLRQLEMLYFEQGLRVMLNTDNIGLARLRNLALQHARYQHLLFLDADNELIPGNISIFYRAALDTRAALVYGNIMRKQLGSDEVEYIVSNESFQDYMFDYSIIDSCAMIDRMQVLDIGGYNSTSEVAEDWELVLHLAVNGRLIVFVPTILGIYYLSPNSMFNDYHASDPGLLNLRKGVERRFNQYHTRGKQPIRTRHLRYHPDVGVL